MTPATKFISILFLALMLFFAANWWQNSISQGEGDFIKLGGMTFHTSIGPGINEAKNQSKPVFLYFRSESCYWCIRFEEEALSDKRVIDILNKNFVLVSVDQIKQKNVATNLGVRSTPYMIFFTKDGEEITRVPGYLPTEDFLLKLNEVLAKLERNK
jgi:thioredoxin-related protein